jgi:hypothetical protein
MGATRDAQDTYQEKKLAYDNGVKAKTAADADIITITAKKNTLDGLLNTATTAV